jgi:hypothetical protein
LIRGLGPGVGVKIIFSSVTTGLSDLSDESDLTTEVQPESCPTRTAQVKSQTQIDTTSCL